MTINPPFFLSAASNSFSNTTTSLLSPPILPFTPCLTFTCSSHVSIPPSPITTGNARSFTYVLTANPIYALPQFNLACNSVILSTSALG
ncbi:hypothetical protein FGO68_gene2854 [Halteria grandinella]|uniref:Uncharacterized protein n=1 Tax=Halteria grandinella TaxID=5974 RepID=A0A8J8P322_HALGN|nr:hypothetical protein FGO68_gene2854 [Halteria grandinella]